ncbi:MAG: sigma-54 dependent transcriptional regulator [Pseudomonadota bacterium]|nr:sigma-54 dependent transcriptional regulator [Pseudomonadota bacterium]
MDACNALIVDDEADIRELIALTLAPMWVTCSIARTLGEAQALLGRQNFSFCITDMRLPDGNGLDLVAHVQRRCPNLPIAVITAHGNVESAVEALKLGAFDFVSKPFDLAVLRNLAATALKMARIGDGRDAAMRPLLLGRSEAMNAVRALIRKLARSQAPVLISGESGTGKELAARLIHLSGPRADKAFVPVNCGAIPENLLESEFFGYKRGSFTGAVQDKAGLFQAASGGTLFLDEVADLPQHMQVKLLRAIQERAVRPVGAAAETAVDVRIISATHKDLARQVEDGEFRQDLFYRLNVIELRMPGLRERGEDIPELVEHILQHLGRKTGLPPPRLTPEAVAALQRYAFPGNVRELENTLERAFTLCEGNAIGPDDLHLPGAATAPPPAPVPPAVADAGKDLESYLEGLEKEAILRALEATRYNKTAAAEKLGISFRALRYRLKKLGLE